MLRVGELPPMVSSSGIENAALLLSRLEEDDARDQNIDVGDTDVISLFPVRAHDTNGTIKETRMGCKRIADTDNNCLKRF